MAAYQFFEAPYSTNEIAGRLIRYESQLFEVKRELGEVHRKLDQLLSALIGDLDQTQTQTQNGPLGSEEFRYYGEGSYQWDLDSNLEVLAPTMGDPYTLPPASMVFGDGEWANPIPPVPENRVDPSLFLTPSGVTGHEDTFRGSENDHYQSIVQRTDTFGQVAEMSKTGLVTTKPNIIEYKTQQESSPPTASSSGEGFSRKENTKQKTRLLAQICRVLNIPQKGGELLALQTIIQRLGGTVPATHEPTEGAIRNVRVRRVRDIRHACFEELGRLVGLEGGRIREVKILERALVRATQLKGDEEGYEAHLVPGPSA